MVPPPFLIRLPMQRSAPTCAEGSGEWVRQPQFEQVHATKRPLLAGDNSCRLTHANGSSRGTNQAPFLHALQTAQHHSYRRRLAHVCELAVAVVHHNNHIRVLRLDGLRSRTNKHQRAVSMAPRRCTQTRKQSKQRARPQDRSYNLTTRSPTLNQTDRPLKAHLDGPLDFVDAQRGSLAPDSS